MMPDEDDGSFSIKMPEDSFLVQIHMSSKLVYGKMENLKLLRNWLRDAFFELSARMKERNGWGDSDDEFIIRRLGNTRFALLEINGCTSGISYLNRKGLIRTRRMLTRTIQAIYKRRKEKKVVRQFPNLDDYDIMGEL